MNSKRKTPNSKPAQRADIEYVNESLRDGLKVLRFLIAAPSRGYTVRDIERGTGLTYDFCRRALITLKMEGLAREFMRAWKPGDIRAALSGFGGNPSVSAGALPTQDVLALAGSMVDRVLTQS